MPTQYHSEYYQKNKEHILKCNKRYKQNNKEVIKAQNNRDRERHKEICMVRTNNYNQKLKSEVLIYYSTMIGVPVCAHPDCLIMDIDMLCIDHIDGGGAKHRAEIGRGRSIYRWLKQNNFPSGYQVLCANHNQKKEIGRRK
jgi:hypothetical protein